MSYGQSTLAWLVVVVWYRLCRARAQEASIASHRTPLIPPCAHRIYRTHPTTHATYSQQHFSASPCTSASAAGCTQGGWQALVRPHEVDLREMPELSSTGARCRLRISVCAPHTAYTPPLLATSGHPVAQDQLDQAGQDRRDQLLLLASRPVVLPHTRPAHTCIVSSYGKCKRYSTTPGAGAQRFTDNVTIDIQHPLLGRR